MKFATSNYSSASIPAYLLNGTIPFDTLDYAAVIPFYLIFLAGLLISLTICVSLFNRIRTARSKILNQDIWVLALSLNELIFSSQILAFLSYNISNGGFSLSSAECIANGILTISCSGFSVQIILLMTIDRYRTFMYKTPMEHKTIFLSIFIVLCSLLVSYSPVMVGYQGVYYGMTPSKLLCMSRWHDKSAFSLGVNSVCLAFVLVPIVVILFAYFRIFLKVRAAKLRIKEFTLVASKSKSDQNTSDTFEPTESMNALERRVLLQSVSIVLCNCAGWTPSFLMIIISLVTGIEPARSFDSFGYISAALAIMMNGLVIIFFDKQIVSDIKKVIWKK